VSEQFLIVSKNKKLQVTGQLFHYQLVNESLAVTQWGALKMRDRKMEDRKMEDQ